MAQPAWHKMKPYYFIDIDVPDAYQLIAIPTLHEMLNITKSGQVLNMQNDQVTEATVTHGAS